MTEVRITNEKTGGQKGRKPERWALVPTEQMAEVARLFGFGAEKYAANNWMLGYDWDLSYEAAVRHLNDFWNGESTHEVTPGDPSTRVSHLASVIFHSLALMFFEKYHQELDNRPCRTVPVLMEAELKQLHDEVKQLAVQAAMESSL